MEHDVVISYSRKDEPLVEKIEAALEKAHISYWLDTKYVGPGTSFAKAISQAIYNCKILLFVWSENSNNSENTANEINLALEFEKTIIPFKIARKLGPSDMTYHLLKLDRIDAFPFEEHHIQELVSSVAQCLGHSQSPTSSSSTSNTRKTQTLQLDNGTYTGETENGTFNGQGTYRWKNGDCYEGEWKNNELDGKGTYYYANGNKYEGQWDNNKKQGKGTFTWKNGDKYIGEWKNDKMDGQGTYYYANGNKYEGQWKEGQMHGQGTYTWSDGTKNSGTWVEDEFRG